MHLHITGSYERDINPADYVTDDMIAYVTTELEPGARAHELAELVGESLEAEMGDALREPIYVDYGWEITGNDIASIQAAYPKLEAEDTPIEAAARALGVDLNQQDDGEQLTLG